MIFTAVLCMGYYQYRTKMCKTAKKRSRSVDIYSYSCFTPFLWNRKTNLRHKKIAALEYAVSFSILEPNFWNNFWIFASFITFYQNFICWCVQYMWTRMYFILYIQTSFLIVFGQQPTDNLQYPKEIVMCCVISVDFGSSSHGFGKNIFPPSCNWQKHLSGWHVVVSVFAHVSIHVMLISQLSFQRKILNFVARLNASFRNFVNRTCSLRAIIPYDRIVTVFSLYFKYAGKNISLNHIILFCSPLMPLIR